ncbi:hypothetical protein LIER_27904 [Lithospermum erythrorhizon]|uniref:Uncharacterized protein n=1 Tax=Lithospermum erythrorhizon TaxID=34254 RepID=A0AAV3RHA8_LITER
MDSLGLVDAPYSGLRFTWSFKNLLTKLDRVLMNQGWNNLGLSCMATFLMMEPTLDHCPVIASVLRVTEDGSRPFKFFNMWTNHPDFLDICATHWRKRVYGSAQFKICTKLKALKNPLQALNIKKFGGISQKASSAKMEFQEAFDCLVGDPDNVSLREKVDKLKKVSKTLSELELSFLKQKAKCQHLLESDKGTKYYHALINKNRARSHISYIVKEDGSKTTSYMEMAEPFVEFYKGLYTRRLSEPINLGILGKGPPAKSNIVFSGCVACLKRSC